MRNFRKSPVALGAAQRGFTLIEMAIVTLIIGILIAAAVNSYRTYDLQRRIDITKENLKEVSEALSEYQAETGAYPLPANRMRASTDVDYGMSVVNPDVAILGGCLDGGGVDVGVCRVNGRDADGDTVPDEVVIGTVPFNTIIPMLLENKLAASQTRDGWGRAFKYAISRSQTVPATFNAIQGAITVEDETGDSLTEPAGSAHFVVLSHGDNGAGAFSNQGGQYDLCLVGATESENCDDDDATFVKGLRSVANNAAYDDDFLRFETYAPSMIWDRTPTDATKIYNLNPGNIGIGTTNPNQRLEVVGAVMTQNLDAPEHCDEGGINCMEAEAIGGAGMSCPSGEAATGIEDNQFVCAPLPSGASSTCGPGMVAIGYSSISGLICSLTP